MRKYLGLPSDQKLVLVQTGFLLWAIRMGLWLLPFQAVQHSLTVLTKLVARSPVTAHGPDRISWAIGVAGRLVPKVTCLVEAMAAQSLLARAGYSSLVRVGARRDQRGGFRAHAWVEVGDRVIVGGGIQDFADFRPFQRASS